MASVTFVVPVAPVAPVASIASIASVASVASVAGRPLLSSVSQRLPDCQNLQGFLYAP